MKKLSCPCPKCGKAKFYKYRVTKANREALCKECAREKRRVNPVGQRTKYTRICKTCGDKSIVGYRPTGDEECYKCSRPEAGRRANEARYKNYVPKRYYYFCPNCSTVNVNTAKRKTPYCGNCIRRVCRLKYVEPIHYSFTEEKMIVPIRHFRICPDCGDTKEMKGTAGSGIKRCRACYDKARAKAKEERAKAKAKPRKKKKVYTPVGTDGAKRNKVTVKLDREKTFVDDMKPTKTEELERRAYTATEEEMIAKFLRSKNAS